MLVINDDDSILDTYEAILRDMGYEAVTKATAASGPEIIRDVGADALIVDLQRSDEHEYGLRIIDELRAEPELETLPIVLATGAGGELEPQLDRLRAMAVEVLRKPFAVGDLESALDSAFNHPHSARDLMTDQPPPDRDRHHEDELPEEPPDEAPERQQRDYQAREEEQPPIHEA